VFDLLRKFTPLVIASDRHLHVIENLIVCRYNVLTSYSRRSIAIVCIAVAVMGTVIYDYVPMRGQYFMYLRTAIYVLSLYDVITVYY
jgi:hypothetical protein